MNKRPIINRRLLATLATALLCLATAAQADKTTYYHNDALGSPVAATDENGDLLWSEEYGPWGERQLREDNGENDLWYTGKQEEAGMGVHYFHARWYAPELGAFLSRDPAGARVDNLHSFNHYIYANNSPYRYTDPDGRIPIDTLFDVASVGIGLANMGRNIQEGNYGAAAADFAGVAVDGLAAAAPYVPGGVGIARAGVTKGLGNPFKNKNLGQIEKAFDKHVKEEKLELKYTNPKSGAKSYQNTKSGYSYNLDPGGKYGRKVEGPHVDVNYPNPKPKTRPPKKKLPVSGDL